MATQRPSLKDFLSSYPFPAFFIPAGARLEPTYSNAAYKELIAPSVRWLDSLATLEQAQLFTEWLVPDYEPRVPQTLTVSLTLPWTILPVQLQLCKTKVEQLQIITSIPVYPFPTRILPSNDSDTRDESEHAPFPLHEFRQPAITATDPTGLVPLLRRRPEINLEKAPLKKLLFGPKEIEEYIEAFPWETTSLGPKDSWPQSLKTACQFIPTILMGERLTCS